MKKTLVQFLFLLSIALVIFSCKKSDDEPGPGWTDEDKSSYQQVINVQDEIGNNLDDWFQSMDSLDAINQAYEAFISNENVSSATINSQGIAVQYANGVRGGIFLRYKDDSGEVGEKLFPEDFQEKTGNGFKSLVNQRKMILINPHYFERSYYTDQVKSIDERNLSKVGMELSTFYKNEEATVDRFTELSGYGIIHIYSHGWAWPKQENITDVYLLTGETANETTSAKYWDELKTGNIPVMKVAGPNKYLVSPKFIADHNDFSNDTVLFYGGFCYSFLGNWPDIIDGFADGAYTGYDWSVYTHKNANWCVNSLFNLSDTTADQPITLNDWFNDTEVPKSYWNERDSRTVHIHYAGDGNLKLWDDVSVRLIPLSSDGAPVSVPGEAGTAYPFRCEVSSNNSDIEYIWDIGDGSSPVSASNEVNITWSEEGNYELSVTAKNNNSGVVIGTAKLNVTIGESSEDVTEFVTSCLKAGCTFKAGIQYSPSGGIWDGLSVNSVPLDWSGLSFTGTYEETDMGIEKKYTVSGSLSSDGQKVSFYAREEVEEPYLNAKHDFSITVADYPLSLISDGGIYDPYAAYGSPYTGNIDVQQYVSNFEGYCISNGITYTVTGVEWDNVIMLCMMFVQENASKVSELPAVQDLEFRGK
ncbi:MAG: PKD domain-containing protein [Bacteroidetes bacterium]|nr:PKD domain-containing protein [Bacteroidota bacterium]